jgi:hypothetical protein
MGPSSPLVKILLPLVVIALEEAALTGGPFMMADEAFERNAPVPDNILPMKQPQMKGAS